MKTSGYNIMRDDSALLEERENSPPSFSVHLYPDHWTLNNGPKFSYNNHVSSILEDIRAFRIPTDFIQIFEDAGVPYYNGCLIVEILDFRPARAKEPILERPDKQRVVLRPNAETVWADICAMNAKSGAKWSDMEALQVESKLLLSTSTPLCLDPDPSLTRIVNSILRVSTPNVPNSLKRKAAAMVDLEEDETEKAKRAKIMQFMNPQFNTTRKPFHPNYKILALMEQRRAAAAAAAQQNPPPSSSVMAPVNVPSGTMAPPSLSLLQAPDKAPTSIIPMLTTSYSQSNTIPQPAPVTMPPAQIPPQLQQAVDPSKKSSPLRQQQTSNNHVPQRPPSQPAAAPQANATNQQPQVQGQQATQPAPFNPPIPPSNFLNPPPGRRRPSAAAKPSTPAASNSSLPVQQPASQAQPQAQMQAHAQPRQQTTSQPQVQSQQMPPQTQQTRPAQVPTNMPSIPNIPQFYQNGRAMPIAQASATIAAQRQALSGRNTPVNGNNPSASPIPTASAIARSPMLPAAAVAAMMSRQNTPVATSNQVARGSPLAGNHPVTARAVAAQNAPQQQAQQPMPGAQPVLMQSGTSANPTIAYQHYMQQQQQRYQAFMRVQAQQAQLHQQGHMSPVPQQQQQNQQPVNAQPQQATQEQPTGAQQPFAGVQVPPQAYNHMQMNMNLAQHPQHYLWPQRMMGRGMAQVQPNGQQQMPAMPPGMTMQQMQGLGRAGGLPNR